MSTGFPDGGDARSRALLRQHLGLPLDQNVANNHLSAQQGRGSVGSELRGKMIPQSRTDTSFVASHGLSDSELMSASSLQNRERIITAELLKRRQQQLGHQEQVAAMALASRNQAFSMQPQRKQQQQDQQEGLILKRAISRLSAISHHPMHHLSHPQNSHQSPYNHHRRCSNSVYCAEQDLSLEKDICFGRGQRVQRRKANVAFRKIVATYQETYEQAVSREDKKSVVKKVSRIFSRTGYRFFKESECTAEYANRSKMWIAVPDHHVEYKISHSFRSGRKQLKQQKNRRKDKESSDASVSSIVVQTNKSQSCSIIAKERNNHCIFKEDELSDKCICIGHKHEKYTGMEAYQYFREFIFTFKSILGMSESYIEKTKIITNLIEQIKSQKGYRFLKLMPLKKDAKFWIEASADEIYCEVFSILGDPIEPIEKQIIPTTKFKNHKRFNNDHKTEDGSSTVNNNGVSSVIGRKNQKRSFDTREDSDGTPKKRQCLSPDRTSKENCSRPAAVKRIISDFEPKTNDDKAGMKSRSILVVSSVPSPQPTVSTSAQKSATKGGSVSSSLVSLTTKVEEMGDSNSISKKGRKKTLPGGFKKHGLVPSKIICKQLAFDKNDGIPVAALSSAKVKNRRDPISKAKEEMSAITTPGLRLPPSLCNFNFGNQSPGPLETLRGNQSLAAIEILQGKDRQSPYRPSIDWAARATLGKAMFAMRSSNHHTGERAMVENANFEAAKQFEMKANMLQHLRQQELLYMEKKHKLALLDLQLRSRNGGI